MKRIVFLAAALVAAVSTSPSAQGTFRAGVDVVSTRYNGLIHECGLLNPLSQVPGVRSALLQASAELRKHLH